ncbi:MAG: protease modulator HflC [Sedimentisphaerales bacterium]|nr:protease modulator HflC [Sedimentisphaerales bacterium]
MKKHAVTIITGLVIVAIIVLYMVTFTVRWKEKALVLSWDKIIRTEDEPGLKWIWPWQSFIRFDGRILTLDQQTVQTQTRDKTTVITTLYINWRIEDPKAFYKSFGKSGDSGEHIIYKAITDNLMGWISNAANVITEYNLGDLVTVDKGSFKLEELEQSMLRNLQQQADSGNFGIKIVDLGIKRLGVPDSVSGDVFKRMKSDREAVITTLLAEGNSQAESIKGEAESKATIIRAEAQAKAKDIMGQGDAEAAQYYATFLENPQLANYLRKLDTLRKTLNERTTIVLDGKSPAFDLLQNEPAVDTKFKDMK